MVASAKQNPFEKFDDQGTLSAARSTPSRLLKGLRVLVVDEDPGAAALVTQAIGGAEAKLPVRKSPKARTTRASDRPSVFRAANLAEAQRILRLLANRGEALDLIIADSAQPDGRGADLLARAAEFQPEARLVITSGTPALTDGLELMRQGVIDYLPKPLVREQVGGQIARAARQRLIEVRNQRRLVRLKSAVRQLNQARHAVSRKVDLLCSDLVNAYADLSRQFEHVRVGEHLRRLLGSAVDLEQLLCHTMDWILRELGYCNIAVYLTGDDGQNELGAYMKHSVAGDPGVTDWLGRHLVPRVTEAGGFFHGGPEVFEKNLTGADAIAGAATLVRQTVMGVDCTYLAESLGTILVFRRAEKPFGANELELLKAAGPVFALALTTLVRGGAGSEKSEKKPPKQDPQDWWKRGEAPPF